MPLINGAHSIVYSTDADADRAFLRDVLGLPAVDVGHGWLIFALPPSEVAVHPAEGNDRHELYLMTDDIHAFVKEMADRGISCGPPKDQPLTPTRFKSISGTCLATARRPSI